MPQRGATTKLSHTFDATEASDAVYVEPGGFVFCLSGTGFSATCVLQRSDDQETWYPIALDTFGGLASFTAATGVLGGDEPCGAWYRWKCTWVSGSPNAIIQQ